MADYPRNRLMIDDPSGYGSPRQNDLLASAWQVNAGAAQDWIARQRAISAQRGLWNDATGLPTQAGVVDAAGQTAQGVLMGSTAPGVRAYHGSPHSFDRFDVSKIGTGEGAQAYGHGLYFAEREGIARGYRDRLSGTPLDDLNAALDDFHPYGGPDAMRPTPENLQAVLGAHANPHLQEAARDPNVIRDLNVMMEGHPLGPSGAHSDAAVKAASRLDTYFNSKSQGKMYEVELKADPEHFLHWDKPLSEQHPVVQEALGYNAAGETRWGKMSGADPTGADVYKTMSELLGKQRQEPAHGWTTVQGGAGWSDVAHDQTAAAAALRDAGIPGIRYLDAGSRGAGEASHNYVVFDPATIEILRKYGIAGLLGGGAAAGTQNQ